MSSPFNSWLVPPVFFCAAQVGAALAEPFETLEARLASHPSLAALEFQADASRERGLAAAALPDPVITLGINNFPVFDPSFSAFLPTNKAIGVRQDIPDPAGRKARADAARAMAEQAARLRAAQFASLRGELVALLHEQHRIRRQRSLADARAAKFDALVRVVEAAIGAGRPAVFRLARIEAKRAEVARLVVDLERQAAEINARLIDLVGQAPATPAPPVTAVEWTGEAMDFHAVQVADTGLSIADHKIAAARAAWRPDWGVQLTYQQRQSGENFEGDDWVSGMVTFTLPLWAGRSQAPLLRAARADRATAEMRYQAAARSAAARYATEVATQRAATDNIMALERNIAAVESEIAARMTTYGTGAGDYAPIIDGEIVLLELRSDIVAEEVRRAVSIARNNAALVTR